MTHALTRFVKYSSVGITTFILDLMLLYIFTDLFLWNYILSAGVAFIVAVSVNYYFSRKLVFKGTLRSVHSGYGIFLIITGVGLVAVTGLMFVFVDMFLWNYLLSRVVIAGIVGLWNYLMNLYVNFQVAGKHQL